MKREDVTKQNKKQFYSIYIKSLKLEFYEGISKNSKLATKLE